MMHGTPTPYSAISTKCGLGDLSVPRAKPVNVEIEDGGETHTGVQRRDGYSAPPVLHVVFSHAQPPRCACRTDAGPFECPCLAANRCTSLNPVPPFYRRQLRPTRRRIETLRVRQSA
jgi:hypothetical protein